MRWLFARSFVAACVAAAAGCTTPETPSAALDDEPALAPATWRVQEHATPVTLDVRSSVDGRTSESREEGLLAAKLDYARTEERALSITAPQREQRFVVTDDAVFVDHDGWRRPIWRTGERPEGAEDFTARSGRREWRVDGDDCLHVTSTWTSETSAPPPWDAVANHEALVWCEGSERSRTLTRSAGESSVTMTWTPSR